MKYAPISTMRDYGTDTLFVILRQEFFSNKYDICVRNGIQPYCFQYFTEDFAKAKELFSKLSQLLLEAEDFEQFCHLFENADLPEEASK